MSAAAGTAWRPVYDAGESVEQFAARQRQAFAAFELAWRDGRVSLKLKGYYDQLVRDVGANAYTWWSEERWADAFGVSRSTIKRVLATLAAAGLIRRERQFGASSRTYLTVYDRAAAPVEDEVDSDTDNHQLDHHPAAAPPFQHDITNDHGADGLGSDVDQNPEAPQKQAETSDYRYPAHAFFGVTSEPTIGSLLHHDPVKTRHLTIGAAGGHPPAAMTDPRAHQVLDREGVADFVVAPRLAQQAAGELQAVSRYLDTQTSVRDRPRLFAWLATHGFGRQLLAGRTGRTSGAARLPRSQPPRPLAAVPTPAPPEQPPTPHAAVWGDVRDRLQADPAAAALQLWLDDVVLLELTDTAAVVGTPNVFVRDAVQPHAVVLARALGQVAGHAVDVRVVVDGWT